MLKPNQFVSVSWNPKTKQYYQDKGYVFTKINDKFEVKVEDLPQTSHKVVTAICDYCGKEISVTMTNYSRSIKRNGKIACSVCRIKKTHETMEKLYGERIPYRIAEIRERGKQTLIDNYGVDTPMKIPEAREKYVSTMKERYGVAAPLQSAVLKEKAKQTLFDNYGVDNSLKSKEVREKAKQTIWSKYGVDNVAKVKEFTNKAKATCVSRYGGESSQCSVEVRQKSWESLRIQGNMPVSKIEQRLFDMIKDIYGEENCTQQYLFDRCSFDCLLRVGDAKIDIEYDGWYWHKDKQEQDRKRDFYTTRRGIKVLRYQSNGLLPTREQIIENVHYLANSEHKHLIVKMSDIQEEDIV